MAGPRALWETKKLGRCALGRTPPIHGLSSISWPEFMFYPDRSGTGSRRAPRPVAMAGSSTVIPALNTNASTTRFPMSVAAKRGRRLASIVYKSNYCLSQCLA